MLRDDSNAIDNATATALVVETSRKSTENWRKERTGVRGGAVQTKAKRMNYYHPLIWIHIDRIAKSTQFSPSKIVQHMQRLFPKTLKRMNKGTVSKWIRSDKRGWTDATLRNVKDGRTLGGSGRVGVLTKYPDIVKEWCEQLLGMRESGVPVTVCVARSILIVIIKKEHDNILNSRFT